MISKQVRNIGQTGSGVNLVDPKDIKQYDLEVDEFYKKTSNNERELKRLGSKYYFQYWGATETICGHCGAVYRFPPTKNSVGDRYTLEDIEQFIQYTQNNKCPCCINPLNVSLSEYPELILGTIQVEILGLEMLKIREVTPLLNWNIPKEKVIRKKKQDK